MSLLLSLTSNGPVLSGQSVPQPPPTPRAPPNAGQGDSRKRIVPGVKSPDKPSAEAWEGGPFLSVDQWLQERPSGAALLLQPTDDLARLRGALNACLIAVDIHRINDGRAYSIAKVLRNRMGYVGRLRAVGAVTADQIFALAAVGFDEFALRPDQEAGVSLAALSSFTNTYHAGLAAGSSAVRRAAVLHAEARLAQLTLTPVVAGAAS